MKKETYLQRISQMLNLEWVDEQSYGVVSEIYVGTISLANNLWGAGSEQVEAIRELKQDMEASTWEVRAKAEFMVAQCKGVLRTIAYDIENDLIGSIQLESQGEVFADFVNVSKTALSEGNVEVAAVLAPKQAKICYFRSITQALYPTRTTPPCRLYRP